MDVPAIHDYLSKDSYWAKNIPFDTVRMALKNSYCIGVYCENKQVGFARIITDYATFAYLADVYVLNEYRRRGLSKRMLEHCMCLDWMQNLRRCMLATADAHDLYKQFGFHSAKNPERFMEILRPTIYK